MSDDPPKVPYYTLVPPIAQRLIGTSKLIGDEVTDEQQEDENFMRELHARAFICERCGWWCGIEELHNDGDEELCEECDRGEDDDDY